MGLVYSNPQRYRCAVCGWVGRFSQSALLHRSDRARCGSPDCGATQLERVDSGRRRRDRVGALGRREVGAVRV